MSGMHQMMRYCRDRETGERYEVLESSDGKKYKLYALSFLGGEGEYTYDKDEFEEKFDWCDSNDLFDLRAD